MLGGGASIRSNFRIGRCKRREKKAGSEATSAVRPTAPDRSSIQARPNTAGKGCSTDAQGRLEADRCVRTNPSNDLRRKRYLVLPGHARQEGPSSEFFGARRRVFQQCFANLRRLSGNLQLQLQRPDEILPHPVVATIACSDEFLVRHRDDVREIQPREKPADPIPYRSEQPSVGKQSLHPLVTGIPGEVPVENPFPALVERTGFRDKDVERIAMEEQARCVRKRMGTPARGRSTSHLANPGSGEAAPAGPFPRSGTRRRLSEPLPRLDAATRPRKFPPA
jgi:hypothetical protein